MVSFSANNKCLPIITGKFLSTKYYSVHYNIVKPAALDPWWVTGFIDGEGCFFINVTKNKEFATGFKVQLVFPLVYMKKIKLYLNKFKITLA